MAIAAAAACVSSYALSLAAPTFEGNPCANKARILFPGGGVTEASTSNIVSALSFNPKWGLLHRAPHPDSTDDRDWYNSVVRAPDDVRGSCAEGVPGDELSCDEYPFYKTREGGPPDAFLKLVPATDQFGKDSQAGYLSSFYRSCGVPNPGGEYFVVPVPVAPFSFHVCGNPPGPG